MFSVTVNWTDSNNLVYSFGLKDNATNATQDNINVGNGLDLRPAPVYAYSRIC